MGVTMMMMTMVMFIMTRTASTVKLVMIPTVHVTGTDVKQGKMSCKDSPEG